MREGLIAEFSRDIVFCFIRSFSYISFFERHEITEGVIYEGEITRVRPAVVATTITKLGTIVVEQTLPLHDDVEKCTVVPVTLTGVVEEVVTTEFFYRAAFRLRSFF